MSTPVLPHPFARGEVQRAEECFICGLPATAEIHGKPPPDVAARFQVSMRRHRTEAGMTLKQMGEHLNMKPQSLHRIETEVGYVPLLTTAHLIASLFNTDLSAFINMGVDSRD